jgi:predicted DNA binding CopG/RHH family protein
MKKKLVLPKFKNEDAERKYWDSFDLTQYYGPGDFVRARFPNLKPTATPISIRIPSYMLSELKIRANRLDIPYQALIKQAIAEKLSSAK